MAFVGMLHPVAATIATEAEGAAITYNAGMVIGKAIQGNVTWNRPDNPLYADDATAEDDNGLTGGSIELGVDDLTDAIDPKHGSVDPAFVPRRYYQVYERRYGFQPNLSILDLLFNQGNESVLYL